MRRGTSTARRTGTRRAATAAALFTCFVAVQAPAQAALPAPVVRSCPNADALPGAVPPRALGTATVCLVNRVRAARGLPRLRLNPHLNTFASTFAQTMVRRRFFAHDIPGGPTFSQRAKASAYARSARRMTMGENIAWATDELATPAAIVDEWLRSPGHRRNVMRRQFRDIGVGVVDAAPEDGWEPDSSATYVLAFGWRARR
jgi:uncharacterized protein YkwD